MKKRYLIFLAIVFASGARAQGLMPVPMPLPGEFRISGKSVPELRRQDMGYARFYAEGFRQSTWSIVSGKGSSAKSGLDARRTMPGFSPKDLAFFCRIEWRLEKAARFPIRIRLGEVQYVDQLESKY